MTHPLSSASAVAAVEHFNRFAACVPPDRLDEFKESVQSVLDAAFEDARLAVYDSMKESAR